MNVVLIFIMIRPLVTRCGINMSVKNLLCQRLFGSTSTPSSKPVTRSMPVENMKESNFVIWENFISVEEEKACLDFVAPALARRRYQGLYSFWLSLTSCLYCALYWIVLIDLSLPRCFFSVFRILECHCGLLLFRKSLG